MQKKQRKSATKMSQKPVANKDKTKMPGEWLYMAPEGITVRRIAEALGETCETELWEAAGVLEIIIGEKCSMDVEQTQIHPKDTVTADFAAKNGCIEVFLVTFAPEMYDVTEGLMKQILNQCGGLFCGDNEDLSPVLRA